MTPETLQQLVVVLIPLILSLTVHEYAHAATAYWLGDDTASRQGRFTLNPISHIDPVGSLVLPGLLVLSGSGVWFGWAKPVPFNPVNFRRNIRMKHGILLTAAAGPISNLLLAAVAAFLFRFFGDDPAALALLEPLVILNVALFFFNLLPVPPLDGSKVLYGLLPDSATGLLRHFDEHKWLAPTLFILVFFYAWRVIGGPVLAVSGWLVTTLGT